MNWLWASTSLTAGIPLIFTYILFCIYSADVTSEISLGWEVLLIDFKSWSKFLLGQIPCLLIQLFFASFLFFFALFCQTVLCYVAVLYCWVWLLIGINILLISLFVYRFIRTVPSCRATRNPRKYHCVVCFSFVLGFDTSSSRCFSLETNSFLLNCTVRIFLFRRYCVFPKQKMKYSLFHNKYLFNFFRSFSLARRIPDKGCGAKVSDHS